MLRDDVVDAEEAEVPRVRDRHRGAGVRDPHSGPPRGPPPEGWGYTPGSAFARVDARLEEIANGLKQFQASDEN